MKKLIILFLLLPTLCWGGMVIQKFSNSGPSNCTGITLGSNATTSSYASSSNNLYFAGYTATSSCVINQLSVVKSDGSSGAKHRLGLWADSSGPTGNPIRSSTEVTTTAAGDDAETLHASITDYTLTSGTKYWIGWATNTAVSTSTAYEGTGDNLYQTWTYSSTGDLPEATTTNSWNKNWSVYADYD